jgi:hypothetical protein
MVKLGWLFLKGRIQMKHYQFVEAIQAAFTEDVRAGRQVDTVGNEIKNYIARLIDDLGPEIKHSDFNISLFAENSPYIGEISVGKLELIFRRVGNTISVTLDGAEIDTLYSNGWEVLSSEGKGQFDETLFYGYLKQFNKSLSALELY